MNPGISSNSTQVDQTRIHYLSAGKGDVILFLHGWPTSAYLWRNIMPALAKSNQVIAMDLPGFGQSDKHLEDSYSFKYYSRMLTGFLDNLGITKVILGVHDLGGPLGLYWMVQDMGRVSKLILLNTLVYPEFSWGVKLFGLATIMPVLKDWLSSPKGIKWAMNFGVHQKQSLPDEVIMQYQKPFEDKNARSVLLKTVQRLSPKGFQEISEKLPSFAGPVQIIFGEKDRILPKVENTMQRVKKDLPQAKMVSLPDCGHFLQEEVPDRIAKILAEFVKS